MEPIEPEVASVAQDRRGRQGTPGGAGSLLGLGSGLGERLGAASVLMVGLWALALWALTR